MTPSIQAPAKVNLCLYLGPTRADGYHELVSVVLPVTLADTVSMSNGSVDSDSVECDGVAGENLAAVALARFREATGWQPPRAVRIDKAIPVAAGMGGGSSDAAAVLRLAAAESGLEADLGAIAFGIGADVPVLLDPRLALMEGAGERVSPLEGNLGGAIVVAPSPEQLSTPEVFSEADRLGSPRSAERLAELRARVVADPLDLNLMVNDLQPAAISLCPSIEPELARVADLGAAHAMVTGSGPTVFGVFLNGAPDAAALKPTDRVVEAYTA